MEALKEAGIKREEVYLTNAVKAFKWKAHNGMKKHVNPSAFEISACRPWLRTELEFIKPKILVCLGASAAQSVFGKIMKVSESRGIVFQTMYSDHTIILPHPSAILRMPDLELKKQMNLNFIEDLLKINLKSVNLKH